MAAAIMLSPLACPLGTWHVSGLFVRNFLLTAAGGTVYPADSMCGLLYIALLFKKEQKVLKRKQEYLNIVYLFAKAS